MEREGDNGTEESEDRLCRGLEGLKSGFWNDLAGGLSRREEMDGVDGGEGVGAGFWMKSVVHALNLCCGSYVTMALLAGPRK